MKEQWTLVQHSASPKAGFTHAVEEASVSSEAVAAKIAKAGGLLFGSYKEASEAEYSENYPPDAEGIYPKVRGTFNAGIQVMGRKLYIPAKAS